MFLENMRKSEESYEEKWGKLKRQKLRDKNTFWGKVRTNISEESYEEKWGK